MNTESFDMQAILETAGGVVSTYALRVVGALAVLIIGRMVAGMVRRSVRKALDRTNLDETLVPFLTNMVYYALLAFVVVAVLNLFGVQTTSLIAVLGAAGLAVGLALQGTLSNFASGVMLLIFRPFKVGDFVEAGGQGGSVKEIGVFATTLATADNVRIVMPNAAIYGQVIKNYSVNDTRRIDFTMGIGYNDDIGKAIQTMQGIMDADERVMKDPAPVIGVHELADSSVNLVVRPWCKREDYWMLRLDLTRRFKEGLEAAGCNIPYPQTDVHLHQVTS